MNIPSLVEAKCSHCDSGKVDVGSILGPQACSSCLGSGFTLVQLPTPPAAAQKARRCPKCGAYTRNSLLARLYHVFTCR